MQYDLEERTAKYSEEIIIFIKNIKKDLLNENILKQLLKSATSIGANYYEANNASSKRGFKNKIYISKKEANETKYWLRLLGKTSPESDKQIKILWKEAQELNMIFQKIVNTSNKKTP
ncbi:MAG: four helix bundle protein [Patescibacteria group bacterium]|nr:four helix bundle protein [Patescibacteria group bacterium]